jgi:hypothetical protein
MAALPNAISPTIAAIEAAIEAAELRDFDHVVRGSSIGHPCERHLFYRFRWAHLPEQFDGRKLRLFHTGHAEEARMIVMAPHDRRRRRGCRSGNRRAVRGRRLQRPLQGPSGRRGDRHRRSARRQRICSNARRTTRSRSNSSSGMAWPSPSRSTSRRCRLTCICGPDARLLSRQAQGQRRALRRARSLRRRPCAALMAKAERIACGGERAGTHQRDPTYYLCKRLQLPELRRLPCRRLRAAQLPDVPSTSRRGRTASGSALRHQTPLSIDDQRAGCPNHLYLPTLVPGEQVDADPKAETVTYRLLNGRRNGSTATTRPLPSGRAGT